MTSTPPQVRLITASALTALTLLLGGCAPSIVGPATPSGTATPTPETDRIPTVAGYDVGEFPPVPLFAIPDISMIDASQSVLSTQLQAAIGEFPGLTVSNTQCDETGAVRSSATGSLVLYGDGSGSFTGPDGAQVNYGDGSGVYSIGGVDVVNYGDGSGSYTNGDVAIVNYGDGSGVYTDASRSLQVYGDGAGSYNSGTVSQTIFGDGAGTYTDGNVVITNYGDGSGIYTGDDLEVQNHGDGTGTVNGIPVDVDPIPPVPSLGRFPSMASLEPLRVCGTTITLSDAVLFDFDESVLRPEAGPVLDALAAALSGAEVAAATVGGHTDAIGSDDYNQRLSEKRAAAVVAALRDRSVTADLDSEGFGESLPVAPNEIDGGDNPAGRQLNRRVEITIPAL
jgi:OOP family OmpA-OmpF porin